MLEPCAPSTIRRSSAFLSGDVVQSTASHEEQPEMIKTAACPRPERLSTLKTCEGEAIHEWYTSGRENHSPPDIQETSNRGVNEECIVLRSQAV